MLIKPFKNDRPDISSLVSGFSGMGGSARDFYGACSVSLAMLRDKECTRILSMSGPAVAIGLKVLFVRSVRRGWFHLLVTNGANLVHDLIDAYGGSHFTAEKSDAFYRSRNFGRIGNVVVDMKHFEKVERELDKIIAPLEGQRLGISDFIGAISARAPKGSLMRTCHDCKVKIYAPGFQDSMLGLYLLFARRKPDISTISDMPALADIVYDSRRMGALMLGGGIPKHFAMGSTVLKEGLDYAVNITTGVDYDASLSGAGLSEGVSWKKVQGRGRYATVHGDYSVYFPLLYSYLRAKL